MRDTATQHRYMRDFALGLASWSAKRFVDAATEHYRVAIRASQGHQPSRYALPTASVTAKLFASSLAADLLELRGLGMGRHSDLLAESSDTTRTTPTLACAPRITPARSARGEGGPDTNPSSSTMPWPSSPGLASRRSSERLGIPGYHTGEIRTIEEARQVYRIVAGIVRSLQRN
jgi:hypothetical protein